MSGRRRLGKGVRETEVREGSQRDKHYKVYSIYILVKIIQLYGNTKLETSRKITEVKQLGPQLALGWATIQVLKRMLYTV